MSAAKFRADIEGLRAIAILLVLIFHANLPLPGGFVGVDVFFVLSGFLITELLVREAENSGRVSLLNFYARRAKRLLPAASLVLGAVTLLSSIWAIETERQLFALDVAAAALYAVNWRFAARAVDYLAEDTGRSPVLHFWSLAVEEQFYFLWPLLIVGSLVVARRLKLSAKRALIPAILCLVVPSFAWSLYYSERTEAFFVSTTRFWELGVGAATALVASRFAPTQQRASASMAGLGVLMILTAAIGIRPGGVAWPGYAALLPTCGTALTLVAGAHCRDSWTGRVLATRPLQFLGAISYSVYLWHWPFLVVGQDWLGHKGPMFGTLLTLFSFLPAYLSHRFIEKPVRQSRSLAETPALAFTIGTTLSFLSATLALGAALGGTAQPTGSGAPSFRLSVKGKDLVPTDKTLGAGALVAKKTARRAGKVQRHYEEIVPAPAVAQEDLPRAYELGCQTSEGRTDIQWCEFGNPKGKRRVVLAGDSLVLQYADALDIIARAKGWRLQTATKSSCAFVLDVSGLPADCARFNESVVEAFELEPPDVVITNQYSKTNASALKSTWSRLTSLGIQVVVIGANPHPPREDSVYRCLLKNPGNHAVCAFSREEGLARSAFEVQRTAASEAGNVSFIDLTGLICAEPMCAPVIGRVLVYRQGAHITNTYVKTLAPMLMNELDAVIKP
jgi:peptidoglycan/LPS O-acetylase OafA/YrhL